MKAKYIDYWAALGMAVFIYLLGERERAHLVVQPG